LNDLETVHGDVHFDFSGGFSPPAFDYTNFYCCVRHGVRRFGTQWVLARFSARLHAKGKGRDTVSNIIWIIMIGFIAGIIARVLSPGPNELGGFILTTALGIAGAFVATFIGQTIGWYRLDQGAGLIGATVGSFLVLFIWNRFVAPRAPAAGDIREPGSSPRRWL
jgi:uncharacterized membrane protein YeaQ/YmgE (transglycosylase-associated protein family)